MWSETEALLNSALSDGSVPGLAVCVHDGEGPVWEYAAGAAELRPESRRADLDTVWDLASLTKVLCTTPLVMSLLESGEVSLETPLLDGLDRAPEGITVAHCLQHASGWPAWRPFFNELGLRRETWGSEAARDAVLEAILETPLEAPPGTQYRYSDLGMIALGFALERWGGAPLSVLFEERIGTPWKVGLTWGNEEAAATEDCPLRGRVVRGDVHDLNAAVLGGVAGHAGLFGTAAQVASAVAVQLRSWRGSGPLSSRLVRDFWSRVGPGSHRLGWDSPSGPTSSAGPHWPACGVGHLAFTGCSVWVSPEDSWIVVFCSNRVHPEVEGGAVPDAVAGPRTRAFKALRPQLHTAIIQALSGQ